MNRDILDIDPGEKFGQLNGEFQILQKRFMALAQDFKYYVDGSWDNHVIFSLRDDTIHRLFSSKLHIELLIRQINLIQRRIAHKQQEDPELFRRRYFGSNPFYDNFGDEVSAIFDSIIFHAVASFDYLSNLCCYICCKNRDTKLKWSSLAKSVRDDKNELSKTKIAATIDAVDRDFIDKLYNHRSNIIHEKSDKSGYDVTMSLTPEATNIYQIFFIGDSLTKKFAELKDLNKSKQITVPFASFWLLNLCVDKITDILFALKDQMESNPKKSIPTFGYLGTDNKVVSPSFQYWHEDAYREKKANSSMTGSH
jgi:hypothetical protein